MWVLGSSQEWPPWVVWCPSSDLHPLNATSQKVVVDFLNGLYFQYTLLLVLVFLATVSFLFEALS